MIRLASVLVLLTAPVAAMADREFAEGRTPTCPQNSDWSKLKRCLEMYDTLVMLHDRPNAKVVQLHGKSTLTPTVLLYMRIDGQWLRMAFQGDVNDHGELLLFTTIPGDGYRLDMGNLYPTAILLAEATTVPAVLRRRVTTVCTKGGGCVSVITACELSVHGKAYFWFRGKPTWNGSVLRVAADMSNAGPQCQVSASSVAPAGAPLL